MQIPNSYSNRQSIQTDNSNRTIAIAPLSKDQEDKVLDTLVNMGVVAESYKLYFIKPLRKLGGATMIEHADKAIKFGKNPQRYFTYLCNRSV